MLFAASERPASGRTERTGGAPKSTPPVRVCFSLARPATLGWRELYTASWDHTPVSVKKHCIDRQIDRQTVSVKKTLLLREPWRCNPAAETPLQPPFWSFSSYFSQGAFFSGGVFFSQTQAGGPDPHLRTFLHSKESKRGVGKKKKKNKELFLKKKNEKKEL